VWLIGVVVCLSCCTAGPLFARAGNGRPHNALWYHFAHANQLLLSRSYKVLLVLSLLARAYSKYLDLYLEPHTGGLRLQTLASPMYGMVIVVFPA